MLSSWLGGLARTGWIVGVEDPAGTLLYVTAIKDALKAEDAVRRALKVPRDVDVWVIRPADPEAIRSFRLRPGQIKGPM